MPEQEQTGLFEELKWMGQPAHRISGLTLASVSDHLPIFERHDFGENEYLDVILRLPFRGDSRTIPVGSVSKRYFLVQHRELVQRISVGLEGVGIRPEHVPVEVWISEYGERVRIQCRCSQRPLDPGDQFPLVLSADCFNSVNKTCALEIRMFWLRVACMNGLMIEEHARLRKIHDMVWMNRDDPGQFIRERLENSDAYFELIQESMKKRTDVRRIAVWVDKVVAEHWTREAAARVYHICSTGFDGAVAPAKGRTPPHEHAVSSDKIVPGACAPVRTVYHAAQALSWVASHRSTVEDQVTWIRKANQLIEQLEYTRVKAGT